MARRLVFEIITKAQTAELARLQALLDGTAKSMKKLDQTGTGLRDIEKSIGKAARSVQEFNNILGSSRRSIGRTIGEDAKDAARDVETLETRLRDLRREQGRADAVRRRAKDLEDDVAAATLRVADAQRKAADARRELNRVQRDPNRTVADIDRAVAAFDAAEKEAASADKQVGKLRQQFRDTGREIQRLERHFNDFSSVVDSALRNPALSKSVTPQVVNSVRTQLDALRSLNQVWQQTGVAAQQAFDKTASGMGAVKGQIGTMRSAIDVAKGLRTELVAMAKIDQQQMARAVGSPQQALTATMNAMRRQNEEAIKLRGNVDRLTVSGDRWAEAEREAARVMSAGNAAMAERTRVTRMFTNALSGARGTETTLSKNLERLRGQQRAYADELVALTDRINNAQSQMMMQPVGSAAYRDAEIRLNDLRTAYSRLDAAIDQNNANIRENEAALGNATRQVQMITQSQQNWQSVMRSVSNPMQAMIAVLQRVNAVALQLATNFAGRLRTAITAAATASRNFVASAGSMFSGLQRALQSVGNAANNFADRFARSMDRAHAATMEMYAAGFSLLTLGRELQQFGMQGFRMMGQSLTGYMEYERRRIQAAVAGAESAEDYYARTGERLPQGQGYRIDNSVIDQMIFDLQRGVGIPWLNDGRPIPVTFNATELAQGLYYYSSAIGVPITEENQARIGAQMSTIMQAAAVTNTGLETAIKGVMNVAMEFGFDPRAVGDMTISAEARDEAAREISKIAAQMAYLSNISTMEMSDIVETFKMVGPMANILSGGGKGAGLEETFLMAFLASEVGLRGGNTGRGINRAFTSMLDPTPKMIEAFSELFPDEIYDVASFRDKFFEAGTDTLKGGIMGFMESLASLPVEKQASALATLFTENATRTLVGTTRKFLEDEGGLDAWLERIRGDNPFEWLGEAAAVTANSVSGWFAFMSNAWFQFQRAVIQSVSGPLMSAFRLIGEVLFEIAERIQVNPAIGRIIASIITAVSTVAVIVGTVMMVAGAILLLGRAFAMAGGFIVPFIRMVAVAGVVFTALVPLFAALAVGAGLLVAVFQSNLFGIADAWESFTGTFTNFEDTWAVWIGNTITGIGRVGMAFQEFMQGILIGQGTTNNLNALMQSVFGPLLGNVLIGQLQRFRDSLDATRQSVRDFLSTSTFNIGVLRNAGAAIQGFMEQLFLGQMRDSTRDAQNIIGRSLGIDNLSEILARYAHGLRQFIAQTVSFGAQMVGVWTSISGEILSNIGRIFAVGGWSEVFASMVNVLQGVATGVLGAFTIILSVVEVVTDQIADMADRLREAEAQGRTFMGMTISFSNALRALGVMIGLVFGARLMLMFSPLARMLVALTPIVTTITSLFIGFGARMLMIAANIAITTAAIAAHIAIMGALLAVKAAAAVAEMVFNAAQAVTSGGAAAQTGIIGILTTAYGILTGSLIVSGGAMSMFGAILTIVSAAALVVVGVLGGFAFVITAIAGAMIIATGVTQGWGAAWQALLSFLGGVWSGLQLGLSVIMMWVGALQAVAGWMSNVTGIGNDFANMGFLVGGAISLIITLLSVLVVTLAAVAGQMVLTWAVALAPMALVVAGIAVIIAALVALGAALTGNTDYLEMFYNGFTTLFDRFGHDAEVAANRMELAFATAIENIINNGKGIIPGLPDALEIDGWSSNVQQQQMERQAKDQQTFSQWVENPAPYENIVSYQDAYGQIWTVDLATGQTISGLGTMGGPANDATRRATAGREHGFIFEDTSFTPTQRNQGIQAIEANTTRRQQQTIENWLTQENILERLNPLLESLGINTDNLSFEGISGELQELMKVPDNLDTMQDFDWSILGPNGAAYDNALNAWETYQDHIQRAVENGMSVAEATAHVNRMYEEQGLAIPTEPVLGDYLMSEAAAVEEGGEALQQAWEQAHSGLIDTLTSMSMEEMVSTLFDFDLGRGGVSVASALVEFGDELIQAAGDRGPWLNMTELLADAAGLGQLDTNIMGQNLHDALMPALEIFAQQTGMTMDEIKDILPKYWAPEELMATATTDLLQGLNEMPRRAFELIDTMGIAEGWTEFGINWAEVATYAAGQAAMGVEWDFADYMADSFGIERARALEWLEANGIDPSVISSAMFGDTEELSLAMNGQLTVMTAEMYTWAQGLLEASNNGALMISESDLKNLPDEIKLYLDSLGIVFVTDNTAGEINAWAGGVTAALNAANAAAADATAFATGSGRTPVVGAPAGAGGRPVSGPTDEGWSAGYGARQQTYNQTRQGQTRAPAAPTTIFQPPVVDTAAWAEAGRAGPVAAREAMVTEISTLTTAVTIEPIEIPISLDFTTFDGDLVWIQTSLSMLGSMGATDIPVSLDFTTFNGDIIWIQTMLSTITATAKEIPINIKINNTEQYNSMVSALNQLRDANTYTVTVDIRIQNTSQYNDMIVALNNLSAREAISVNIDLSIGNTGQFNDMVLALNTLQDREAVTVDITINANQQPITDVNTSLVNLTDTSWTAIVAANTFGATGPIEQVLVKLRYLTTGSWTALVMANVSGAASSIESILQKLRYLTTGSWNATVGINDNASGTLSSIQRQLNNINGRNATATVTVRNTTINDTINRTRDVMGFASGGWAQRGQVAMVGEEGPELVYFPTTGYVYNAPETAEMANSLSQHPLSTNVKVRHNAAGGERSVALPASETNLNFYGDIVINDRAAAREFFDQLDRRMGKRTEMSRRGMGAIDDTRSW